MKIRLNEMIFYGYHGVEPEERKLGQRFIVDFTYETDIRNDQKIHHIDETVDYSRVYEIIKNVMENDEYHLLENCANSLLDNVLDWFPKITKAKVRIQKPSVPINGTLKSVEIEMERTRK